MKPKGKKSRQSGEFSDASDSPKQQKKPLKDVNAPKPPMSAYNYYMNEHRDEFKNVPNYREAISRLAAQWRSMSEDEKKVYVDQASGEMNQYKVDLKNYRNSDTFKKFLKEREKYRNEDAKVEPSEKKHSTQKNRSINVNGTPVFSEEFLAYNKTRESDMRKFQRQIAEVEDETELITKNITSLSGKLEVMQESIYNDEVDITHMDQTIEKWRKITLKAIEDAKLLGQFHLTTASSAKELVSKLEEASQKSDSINTIALRQSLSSVSYA
ncbi:HMG-box domain-containing protein [Ditylenchus destructor]|nr:HMG-box domain-containing protein [Ditylenchus destructor]